MQQVQDNPNYQFKMIAMGNYGVGKTKLAERFSTNTFKEDSMCTVGTELILRTVKVYEDTVKFQVWDFNGAERYRAVPPMYYRGASGIIMVFDITNRRSFTELTSYHEEILIHLERDSAVIIVGTKTDLEEKRVVTIDEAKDFADKLGYMYIETSAKSGLNVDNAYLLLAKTIIEKTKSKENGSESENIVKINKAPESSKKRLPCIG